MAGVGKSVRRPPAKMWLDRYLGVQKKQDVLVRKLLTEAAKHVEAEILALGDKPGIGVMARRAQLIGTKGVIHRALAEFWAKMSTNVRRGREDALAASLEASFDWDEILLARAYPDLKDREHIRDYLLTSADKNIEAMLRRMLGGNVTLSAKVYSAKTISAGWVDKTVAQGLLKGSSAADMAKSVKSLILPSTPGGVTYAAMRLSRTEINNVYHAQTIDENRKKPWNTGMRWYNSKSHKVPDLCDQYAALNGGIFPLDKVPKKPHPQCFCYCAPETLSTEEFDSKLLAGEFDGYMEKRYGLAMAS